MNREEERFVRARLSTAESVQEDALQTLQECCARLQNMLDVVTAYLKDAERQQDPRPLPDLPSVGEIDELMRVVREQARTAEECRRSLELQGRRAS